MTPSSVRRIMLRTGKTCLKVLRSLATAPRLQRSQRVLPAPLDAAAADKAARKAAVFAAHDALDDVVDLEDLQNRLNEAAERKLYH